MTDLKTVIDNIEKFKHSDTQMERMEDDRFVYEPLKFAQYGFAIFSKEEYKPKLEKLKDCQYKHRYYYFEKFNNDNEKNVIFIMFNPSSANPEKDDPTVHNCRKLATEENKYGNKYSSMEIINIFSERNPEADKIDTNNNNKNEYFIEEFLKNRKNTDVVIAWGYGKEEKYKDQIEQIQKLIKDNNKYKITIKKEALKEIQKADRHPAPSNWIALGGFDGVAQLEKYE